MFCPKCAYPNIPAGARFCPECGAAIPTSLTPYPSPPIPPDFGRPGGQESGRPVEPATPLPSAEVTIMQTIGRQEGGRATGLEIGQAGMVNVYLTLPTAPRAQVPPAGRHPIFGREAELAQITAGLAPRRTVLLHGMGGIGKTALAAAAVEHLFRSTESGSERGFKDGILWVSEIGTAALGTVCDTIARSLGDETVLKSPTDAKPDATRALLAGRDLLLVLDDLASPETAEGFLSRCLPPVMGAGIALLATSRQHHLGFDLDVPIRPLDRDAAIALFRDRAKMPDANGVVGQICDLLEDHPLALVIAAGRARGEAMPLSRLYARLADEKTRLQALKLGEDKSHNVWASLRLSWDGLDEAQCLVWGTLAACFGESTGLELLAEACALSPIECEDQLGRLVMQSLAQREGDRFTLHRLVRDFGRDALAAGLEAVQERVLRAAQAYVARYVQSEIPVRGKTTGHHDRLEAELGNLLGAVHHAAERQDWPTVLSLAQPLGSLNGVLLVRGYWTELATLGGLAMAAAESLADERALARMAQTTAFVLQAQGNFADARRLCQQSLAIFERLGESSALADSMNLLGMIHLQQGDYAEARRLFEQSLEAFRELDNQAPHIGGPAPRYGGQAGVAGGLLQLGMVALAQGDYAGARRCYEQSLEIYERLGDQEGIASNLSQIGIITALEKGDYTEARALFEQGLKTFEQLGNRAAIAGNLLQLGGIALAQGNYAEARRCFIQSLEIFEKLEARAGIASALGQLGATAQAQGDHAGARRLYEKSLAIAQELGLQEQTANTLYLLGTIAQEQGDLAEAQQFHKRSLAIFQELRSQAGVAGNLLQLGGLAFAQNDYTQAQRFHEQRLEILEKLGDQAGMAECLRQLGMLACLQEDYQRGLELFERVGDQSLVAFCLENLGQNALMQGDDVRARAFYERSCQIREQLGDQDNLVPDLAILAAIAEQQKDYAEAQRLIQQCLAILERQGSPLAEAARQNLANLKELLKSERSS